MTAPVYIPSKSRADTALTPKVLENLGVPYRIIVEEQQFDDYALHHDPDRLLVLDPEFQRDYETLDDLGMSKSLGPGPARNFAWAHSISEGHDWHWVMDDNISLFARLHDNQRIPVGDGTIFDAMEDFSARYTNVGMSGPHYWMFKASRFKWPPYVLGHRVYSCNLIRNEIPYKWRGRYNEDTILGIDLCKGGWQTILFNAFLQYKITTQVMRGGNSEEFYDHEGTLPKSQMLVRCHPDVSKVTWRYGRWHHHVNYKPFEKIPLKKDPAYEPPGKNPYEFELQNVKESAHA